MADPLPAIELFMIMAVLALISAIFSFFQNQLILLASDPEPIRSMDNTVLSTFDKVGLHLRAHLQFYVYLCRAGTILPLIAAGMIAVESRSRIFTAVLVVLVVIVYMVCGSSISKLWLRRRKNKQSSSVSISKSDHKESALLSQNLLEFSSRTAKEIMIPRTEMICLNTEWSVHENLKTASIEMRTRYPVCRGDKDHIIGFVHIKDLFMSGMEDYIRTIRPILSIPESTSIDLLLKQMKESKTQISIVIDEYGGTSGLVTLEDIVEEIVGEIQDEFDNERPLVEYLGEDVYSIDGLMLIEDLNQHFDLCLEDIQYDTIGGWLFSELESSSPQKGEYIIKAGFRYVIEEMEHLRISRILLSPKQDTNEQTGT
ncbi:hemolysin family protein [Paenibacillus gallinarum]|nr:hemolysin family protein [Paenibacillus gallinarum]